VPTTERLEGWWQRRRMCRGRGAVDPAAGSDSTVHARSVRREKKKNDRHEMVDVRTVQGCIMHKPLLWLNTTGGAAEQYVHVYCCLVSACPSHTYVQWTLYTRCTLCIRMYVHIPAHLPALRTAKTGYDAC
jgi:hypothetical protein